MHQVPKQYHDDGCLLAGLLRRHPGKLVSFASSAALISSGERTRATVSIRSVSTGAVVWCPAVSDDVSLARTRKLTSTSFHHRKADP